ncbi:MAG: 30S ribosomal protein S4 [Chloroflexi bacterium]|nr:30S ribosomal protein S4 [Chloroflexota bacterium]
MARYTGPRCKLCRRLGVKLFSKGERCYGPKCEMEPARHPFPPGPRAQRRRKSSDYALQLKEKQKVRYIYGVLERQFRRSFEEAERRPGATGENLLRLLEMRLDNVIYRLGFADTRNQARQLVTHGHFMVDGRRTNIPSYEIRINQTISVRPESKGLEYFQTLSGELARKSIPGWLSLDATNLIGKVLAAPSREDFEPNINEPLIVEYYSR